jgi:hypothetical protein
MDLNLKAVRYLLQIAPLDVRHDSAFIDNSNLSLSIAVN